MFLKKETVQFFVLLLDDSLLLKKNYFRFLNFYVTGEMFSTSIYLERKKIWFPEKKYLKKVLI